MLSKRGQHLAANSTEELALSPGTHPDAEREPQTLSASAALNRPLASGTTQRKLGKGINRPPPGHSVLIRTKQGGEGGPQL